MQTLAETVDHMRLYCQYRDYSGAFGGADPSDYPSCRLL